MLREVSLLLIFATGCQPVVPATSDDSDPDTLALDGPTWHADVAPIVAQRCLTCHGANGVAQLPLETPEQVISVAPMVAASVRSGRMPPWYAEDEGCEPPLPWKDDIRLKPDERETLLGWLEGSQLIGAADEAAPLPPVRTYALPESNLIIEHPVTIEIPPGVDRQVCAIYDLGNQGKDVWITAIQVMPSNRSVMHHASIITAPPSTFAGVETDEYGIWDCELPYGPEIQMLQSWSPSTYPNIAPPGVAMRVPDGHLFVVQYHYHPKVEATVDRPSVQMRLTDTAPEHVLQHWILDSTRPSDSYADGLLPGSGDRDGVPEFRIPSGTTNHRETARFRWEIMPAPARIYAVAPHMHAAGLRFRAWLEKPGSSDPQVRSDATCLLQSGWDYHDEREYIYDGALEDLPLIEAGDALVYECEYDNSPSNQLLAAYSDELGFAFPRDIGDGLLPIDEMCKIQLKFIY